MPHSDATEEYDLTDVTQTLPRGIPRYRELVTPAGTRPHGHRKKRHARTQGMYAVIVALWALLCVPLALAARPVIEAGFARNAGIGLAAGITTAFIAYFWLNGTKDVVYPLAYRLVPWRRQALAPRASRDLPLVGLVYPTCNDFSARSLGSSLAQDYANCEIIILDDSDSPAYKKEVDEFAEERGIPVVRREGRKGYKAGNLNHYLRSADGQRLDYFVIVDSDEILPPHFITRALDYFEDRGVGIVQANHVATRNRTTFMKTFAPGVDAHWPAYQKVKDRAGFLSLLGHGAMVSRAAYEAAGGFPEIVAEDIGFAIDAQRAGYRTAFALDIVCEEEFPPDYAAFKKRHKKWTEGNVEFIRNYTPKIVFSRQLRWFEKLDIILFTYSLPLTGVFSLYVLVNAVLFPLLRFNSRYPLWMLVPTVAFLLAPMLNDALTWRHAPKGRLLSYLAHSVALFGSVYFASLFACVRTTFRASVFHVTPKHSGSTSLRSALRHNRAEIIAGIALGGAVEWASGSILAVVLILIPVTFSPYLSVMNAGDKPPDGLDGGHILSEKDQ
jgi:cellulose synthase/poly-beta-1,6-N-acetylglucosamine synthase-like glycosyltransferase